MIVEPLGPDVRIHCPAAPPQLWVSTPGSKSLTNRALACAAQAAGVSLLRGVSLSDDAERMIAGLGALGVVCDVMPAAADLSVRGCSHAWPQTQAVLDAGHAGTAMRFLTALAALGQGEYLLNGSARMRQRPIGPLAAALQTLGARIEYVATPGCPPLRLMARGLTGGGVRFDQPQSSQFVSALLLAAPGAQQDVFIEIDGPLVSRPYVSLTLEMLRNFGVEVLAGDEPRYIVPAPQPFRPGAVIIEPDASAATYFWAAAAVTGGCVGVRGLRRDSAQGDARFVDVLAQMGCHVIEDDAGLAVRGPGAGELRGVDVDLNDMPDTVQTLAVTALFARGTTTIRNVANLRLKETDRLTALAAELSKFGAEVRLREDGLTIAPPPRPVAAEVETYEDHRMAMSFAVAGLVQPGVVIRDAGCVAKSFPGFFRTFSELAGGTTKAGNPG